MKKLNKLKSFEDFKSLSALTHEHSSDITKQRILKESAFKVGDDYKVKVTFDVPISMVKEYIKKVQNETGKNALSNFSETELAEQMVQYIIKNHLVIDQIPSSIAVGDEIAEEEVKEEEKSDAKNVEAEFSTEPKEETPKETQPNNIDINDSDLNIDKDEEGENIDLGEDKDENDLDLNDNEEVDLGEKREVKPEVSQEEEEEYDLDSDSDIVTTIKVPLIDMILYLTRLDIDVNIENQEIVNLYNKISNNNAIGIDNDGNEILPDDSDLY